jgi:hypothetical protein
MKRKQRAPLLLKQKQEQDNEENKKIEVKGIYKFKMFFNISSLIVSFVS